MPRCPEENAMPGASLGDGLITEEYPYDQSKTLQREPSSLASHSQLQSSSENVPSDSSFRVSLTL